MYSLRCTFLSMLLMGSLVTLPAATIHAAQASSEGSVTIGSVQAPDGAEKPAPAARESAASPADAENPVAAAAEPAAGSVADPGTDVAENSPAADKEQIRPKDQGQLQVQTENQPQSETDQPDRAADPAAGESALKGFVPSVALVRHLVKESELPAMRLSLGLVNFVGEVDGAYPGEDSFAILPLGHDAVVEVYELSYDGREVIQPKEPSVVREMGANEAYVLRVPYFAGHPTREICVKTGGKRHCWRPGSEELGEGFLSWKRTKGMK